MVQRIPPPVGAAVKDPVFNRWLIELVNILNANGEIDPGSVAGLNALVVQVAASATAITALNTAVAANTAAITALNTSVAANTVAITALQARAQVRNGTGTPAAGLGSVGDWYGDTAGAAGARVWIKTAPGVWTAFPF